MAFSTASSRRSSSERASRLNYLLLLEDGLYHKRHLGAPKLVLFWRTMTLVPRFIAFV